MEQLNIADSLLQICLANSVLILKKEEGGNTPLTWVLQEGQEVLTYLGTNLD